MSFSEKEDREIKAPGKTKIFALVLAAGESSRMGEPKQFLTYGGASFLTRAIEGFIRAGVDDIVVVCGYKFESMKEHILGSRYSIAAGELLKRLTIVENPDYSKGQLSSIKAGLEAFGRKKAIDFYKGFMIQLIDRPLVRYDTFKQLKERFAADDACAILLPSYEMKRGHPACFSSKFIGGILGLGGGESLKTILAENEKDIRYLEVDDAGIITNVDTPLEYEKIKGVANVD
jgi:molybdenum cofactor cytidylyltransferase